MAIIRVRCSVLEHDIGILSVLAIHGKLEVVSYPADDLFAAFQDPVWDMYVDIPGFEPHELVLVRVYFGNETRSGATISVVERYSDAANDVEYNPTEYSLSYSYLYSSHGYERGTLIHGDN